MHNVLAITPRDPSEDMMATKSDVKIRANLIAEAKEEQRRKLGQIIRECRGELTQTELAARLTAVRGQNDGYVPQTTISRWEGGMVDLSVEQIQDVEEALKLKRGTILLAAGLIELEERDIRAMIRSEPTIHPSLRGDVERIVRSYQETSKLLFDAERPAARRRPQKVRS